MAEEMKGNGNGEDSTERQAGASGKTALAGRKGGWVQKHPSMTKLHDLQHATHIHLQLSNIT